MNKRGPEMDPWGTPKRILKYFEELLPRHTKCERFVKKFAIQRRADSVIPNCNSRTSKSMEWPTQLFRCWCGGLWKISAGETWKQWRSTTIDARIKKSYGFDLKKEEKLDRSYAKGGDRRSDDRKKTNGKKTSGYAVWVTEKGDVCGINTCRFEVRIVLQ